MIKLEKQLLLSRCPYCNIDNPNLALVFSHSTNNSSQRHLRYWKGYVCIRCGGITIASAESQDGVVNEIYPEFTQLDEDLPTAAKEYLRQALDSVHAPAGSIMLCASAVDAMLKAKDYKDGSLYVRINKAVEEHLITPEMAEWAHQVRLDANEPRHADNSAELPTEDEAKKCINFTLALGQFLFVLPARVEKGIQETRNESE